MYYLDTFLYYKNTSIHNRLSMPNRQTATKHFNIIKYLY